MRDCTMTENNEFFRMLPQHPESEGIQTERERERSNQPIGVKRNLNYDYKVNEVKKVN